MKLTQILGETLRPVKSPILVNPAHIAWVEPAKTAGLNTIIHMSSGEKITVVEKLDVAPSGCFVIVSS
jgi:uncharacterized protein YlzI (FlbEa/FlbD family)